MVLCTQEHKEPTTITAAEYFIFRRIRRAHKHIHTYTQIMSVTMQTQPACKQGNEKYSVSFFDKLEFIPTASIFFVVVKLPAQIGFVFLPTFLWNASTTLHQFDLLGHLRCAWWCERSLFGNQSSHKLVCPWVQVFCAQEWYRSRSNASVHTLGILSHGNGRSRPAMCSFQRI